MTSSVASDGSRFIFFSSRRRLTRYLRGWSSDVCSSDLHRRLRGRRQPLAAAELVVEGVEVGHLALALRALAVEDRKSVVQGKSVDLGGRCIIKKKNHRTYPRL